MARVEVGGGGGGLQALQFIRSNRNPSITIYLSLTHSDFFA